ncbi:MAG: dolichyl-phosphate beta-D-mannosyltransferase [Deltaproteobacteria bacterium]|nr:dolichyl-phosphate beta-D-mannosyltransferase [Deltaproteobacteria bacterium]
MATGDDILIVLPTYNEVDNVCDLIRLILKVDSRIEVLVVDDSSPDGTAAAVEELKTDEPRVHLLVRPGKLGLGTAYLAGFRFGLDKGCSIVFTMDCDFSHNPSYLPEMIGRLGDSDMVVGSRYVPGGGIENWPWYRLVLSRFANVYARTLLRLKVRDCTAGFRGYRREVLETVDPFSIRSSGYSFLEEMAWKVTRYGFSISEVPIVFEQRKAGSSKIESREIYLAAWTVLRTAFKRHPDPIRKTRQTRKKI